MSDTERLLRTLPLPLAQLFRRALNGKSSIERHNNAYYLAEATLKLAASLRIGVWLEHALDTANPLARSLEALALPSAGHWLSLLRDADGELAKRPDAALLPVGDIYGRVGKANEGPARAALAKAALEEGILTDEVVRAVKKEGVIGFFGFIVAYRNTVIGHGAQRTRAFYDAFDPLWIAALAELLALPELFGDAKLAHARQQEDGIAWQDLTGLAGFPMASPPKAKVVPARLYFAGAGAIVSLHPLAVYQEDDVGHESVGILNKTTRRTRRDAKEPIEEVRRADYLDYSTGENMQGVDAREALTTLLSKLRGKPVTADEAKRVQDATAAVDASEQVDEVLTTGSAIGNFELLEEVGRGAMGIVYRARQRNLNRIVALKVLPPALAADAATTERFKREVAALARCDHPHVVKVFTSGVDGDRNYFAMEYVEGADLARAAKILSDFRSSGAPLSSRNLEEAAVSSRISTRLATGEKAAVPTLERDADFYKHVAKLFAGVARGLQHLHERGIIHRDIKPGNLMLTLDGDRLVVMDLGLAKLADEGEALTKSSVKVLGTLRYMPPEQLVRKMQAIDARVDDYALAASLYEIASGKPLHDGETEAELVHQVIAAEPPRADEVDKKVPRDLATILAVATSKDRERRYKSSDKLAEDLEAFAAGRPIKASPPGAFARLSRRARENRGAMGAIAALVVVGAGGGGWRWWSEQDHIEYCAATVAKRGALTCVGPLTEAEQRKRATSFRFVHRHGRVVRVETVNGRGIRAADNVGAIDDAGHEGIWEHVYRDDGRLSEIVVRSWEGDFIRREVFSEDATHVEWRDRNDQPQKLDGSDLAIHTHTFDERGFETKEMFSNVFRAPRPDAIGAYGYQSDLDPRGLVVAETALAADGKPVTTRDGWRSRKFTYDARGEQIEIHYLDAGAHPVVTPQNWSERIQKRDDVGNIVHVAFRGPNGPLVDRRLGAACIKTTRNERGEATEQTALTEDGRETTTNGGYSHYRVTFDDKGRTIAFSFIGPDGKPVLLPAGYAGGTRKPDERGHYIELHYLGVNGEPTAGRLGNAGFLKKFDDDGDVTENAFLGVDGKLTRSNLGYARLTQTFDPRGNVLSTTYFDVDGAPALVAGCARLTYRYDERGNRTERGCADHAGTPQRQDGLYAFSRSTFDERANEVEKSYVDADGRTLVEGPGREAPRTVRKFDEKGNVIEAAFFGPDEKVYLDWQGRAGIKSAYDARGLLQSERYFGVDRGPVISARGAAELRFAYDERGRKSEETAIGLDGKPAFVTRWKYGDNRTDESTFDASGAPILSSDGIATISRKFDAHGHEVSIAYLGLDGAPKARKSDGAIGARTWIDSGAQVLRRVRYDAQNLPVSGDSDMAKLEWTMAQSKLVVTGPHGQRIDEAKRAVAEAKVAAWCAGFKAALLRDRTPETFHGANGALVVTVADHTNAKRAGLQPGDVIVEAQARKVKRVQDVQEAIDGGATSLLVLRDGTAVHLDNIDRGPLGADLEIE
jgi:serine/threonine protein kinase